MHNVLKLRPQSGDPTTTATQTALYNKLVTSIPELFFRPNSNQTPIQLTYPSIKSDSTNTQYTFVAGPFVIYGGLVTAPTNGQTVTLTPATTLIYVDLIVTNSTFSGISMAIPTTITANSFNIEYGAASGSFDVYYFAVGL